MCVLVFVFLFIENPELLNDLDLMEEGRGQPLIETTTAQLNLNATKDTAVAGVRQDIVSQEIQVVQDLNDSQESSAAVSGSEPASGSGSITSSAAESYEQSDSGSVSNDVSKPIESNEVLPKPTEKPVNENDPNPINKFCSCSVSSCKCCRDFSIPLVPLRGPGCATVRYLENDRLAVSIKYGDFVLASRTVDSRRPTPICLPLPGGYNRFCGRVYGKEN